VDVTALLLALCVGMALGTVLGLLFMRSRLAASVATAVAAAVAETQARFQAQIAQAQASLAALSERERAGAERLAALSCELDAVRGEAASLREELRAETGRRAKAEESAARVPGLEARVAEFSRQLAEAGSRESELAARMQEAAKASVEREALLKDLQTQLQNTFKALSADALASNNQNFLELAAQHLAKVQEAGKGDLELRQKSIEGLVKPIRETLTQVDTRIQDLEKQRVEAYAGLTQQVRQLMGEQGELRRETRKLVDALRRPSVRGRWGEMQLRRVVELAGMINYCDFTEQASVTTEDGRLRPDMVIRLPGGKNVVVDAKAPLEAYLDAQEAADEDARRQRMQTHARQIRDHLTKLGQKAYWEHLQPTPEFVVMFLPGEIFFSSALEHDPSLIEEGVNQRVIVSSPTTLIALLRAVAYGWRQERVAESAQQVSELGRELYKRIATLADHFAKVGKGLGSAVDAYNKTVSSLESRVLVQARRFKDLGAATQEELPELDPLEKSPRELQQNGED
jgi:DNA recombination protein RmuC